MDMPSFRYHPDPIATGSVVERDDDCLCCGERRGLIYVGPFFSEEEVEEQLCPWCIDDGSAAEKFDGLFVDDAQLVGLNPEVVEEVTRRTPSYSGWQEEVWLSHCGDACEFHGLAKLEELSAASQEVRQAWNKRDLLDWDRAVASYARGEDISFYKFLCRHCGQFLTATDFS